MYLWCQKWPLCQRCLLISYCFCKILYLWNIDVKHILNSLRVSQWLSLCILVSLSVSLSLSGLTHPYIESQKLHVHTFVQKQSSQTHKSLHPKTVSLSHTHTNMHKHGYKTHIVATACRCRYLHTRPYMCSKKQSSSTNALTQSNLSHSQTAWPSK